MKRTQLAKPHYRMPVSSFRSDLTKLLHRVDAGEAFVVTRREASADGWQEEDIAVLVPLNATARDFELIQEQLRADAEKAAKAEEQERERASEENAPERVRSGVRTVGTIAGDAKRGRRQNG